MAPEKNAETAKQSTTWLRGRLQEALEITSTDAELVDLIITNGALEKAVQVGTYNTQEAAQALGIGVRSVRTLATQSTIFPRPTVKERRYSRSDIETYANTRQKRAPRADAQEGSE